MVKRLYIISSICVLFFSCKKESTDGNDVTFPLTVLAERLAVKTPFKLYTKDGEITNATIKNKYKTSIDFYNLENAELNENEGLTFLSADTAIFTDFVNRKFSIERNAKLFLFQSNHRIFGFNNDFIHDILKYQSARQPLAASIGFDYYSREIRVANGSYSNLKMTIISYFLKRGDDDSWSKYSGSVYNEFNSASLSKLEARDTLAIQEYTLTLKAK